MKPELQHHLDTLVGVAPGIDQEGHPSHGEYLKLKKSLETLSGIPKKDWGKESTKEAIKEVGNESTSTQ